MIVFQPAVETDGVVTVSQYSESVVSDRRVVVRKNVDVADAVDAVVVEHGLSVRVVSGHVLLDKHGQVDAPAADGRIRDIADVVDREVVVTLVFQEIRDPRPFVVQHVRVAENVAGVQQRIRGVAEDDRLDKPVAEVVTDRPDAERLSLTGMELGLCGSRCRLWETYFRVEESLAVHVYFHTAGRECRLG